MERLTFAMMQTLVRSKLVGDMASTVIVDVRGADEIKSTGAIPTAINIPLDRLDAALKKPAEDFKEIYNFNKPNPTDSIVTTCLRGGRAESAAGIFTANGFSQVSVYPGSWMEWSANFKP